MQLADPASPHPTILHVDLDAFYVAVEVLDDPGLAGRPVVVGGTSNRGVVASCSYEARAYGIRSAMPSVRARRLCPDALFLPPRPDRYREYSQRFHTLLTSVTPLVEGIGLDEAFLDVSGARRLFGDGAAVAHLLRRRVREELELWASVGVATTKLVAKLASEAAKPKASLEGPVSGLGVKVVRAEEALAFLHPMPVEALWGVGPATRKRLDRFGVATIGDLAAVPEETLVAALGSLGRQLHALAWGRDERAVTPGRPAKSVGHEETFERDLHRREDLAQQVSRLAGLVAIRLRERGLAGRTVTLKVRFGSFRTITRSRTVAEPVYDATAVGEAGQELLAGVELTGGVRLLGLSVSNLVARPAQQLTLDEGDVAGSDPAAVARAVEGVRRRFGDGAVARATVVEGHPPPRSGNGPSALLDERRVREDGGETGT